mgnify:CR=1 FL=1
MDAIKLHILKIEKSSDGKGSAKRVVWLALWWFSQQCCRPPLDMDSQLTRSPWLSVSYRNNISCNKSAKIWWMFRPWSRPGPVPTPMNPTPTDGRSVQNAGLFCGRPPFRERLAKKIAAANPEMKLVHTDKGIEKLAMAAHHLFDDAEGHHEEDEHHHERGEDEHASDLHDHGGHDPHIWLSPPLVKIQARTILAALQEVDPVHQSVYEANFKAFTAEIDRLDAGLKKIFAGKKGLHFMVFHSAWGYFAQTYGIRQVPIEIEGKAPKPAS